jgi:hypothetical protein
VYVEVCNACPEESIEELAERIVQVNPPYTIMCIKPTLYTIICNKPNPYTIICIKPTLSIVCVLNPPFLYHKPIKPTLSEIERVAANPDLQVVNPIL